MKAKGSKTPRIIDRVKLSTQQYHDLVRDVDQGVQPPAGPDKRIEPRFPYLVEGGIIIQVNHPGGSIANYLVRPRTISHRGISFFHGAFLHDETPCRFFLKTRAGEAVLREGFTVHCRHIARGLHEVGASFSDAITLDPFIKEPAHMTTASAARPRFQGRLLCIEPIDTDRRLLSFQAGQLGVEVVETADPTRGPDMVRKGHFDMVIIADPASAAGPVSILTRGDLAMAIRESGFTGPLVQWGPGDDTAETAGVEPAGPVAALPKPFDIEQVQQLFQAHLSAEGHASEPEPLESTHWQDPTMQPMLLNYLESLEEQMLQIEKLLGPDSRGELGRLVTQLGRSAASYGYPSIFQAANAVLTAIDGGDGPETDRCTRTLLELCAAACHYRAHLNYAAA